MGYSYDLEVSAPIKGLAQGHIIISRILDHIDESEDWSKVNESVFYLTVQGRSRDESDINPILEKLASEFNTTFEVSYRSEYTDGGSINYYIGPDAEELMLDAQLQDLFNTICKVLYEPHPAEPFTLSDERYKMIAKLVKHPKFGNLTRVLDDMTNTVYRAWNE